jgi:hypothetical protein
LPDHSKGSYGSQEVYGTVADIDNAEEIGSPIVRTQETDVEEEETTSQQGSRYDEN